VKKLGAREVHCGDAVDVMERQKRMYDAIVDTVGGKAIWRAARKRLLPSSTVRA